MKPDKFGVVIIQFLRPKDRKTGQILHDETLKYKKFQEGDLVTDFYDVHSRDEFVEILQSLIQRIKDENYFFILHIESHGDRFEGLGTCLEELVSWEELFYYTRQINILFDGALLLMMALCHGNSVIRAIKINDRAPFMCLIGSFRILYDDEIERGFNVFYDTYFFELDLTKALEAMNNEIDSNPPLFWVTTNEYCFEHISAPKHDSAIFWMLLCHEINDYYTEHKNTRLTLAEVATVCDAYLQKEFIKAQKYKDLFLFKDKRMS
jgi:hypothetical protein